MARLPGLPVPAVVRQSNGLQRFMLLLGFGLIAVFPVVAGLAPWIAPSDFHPVPHPAPPVPAVVRQSHGLQRFMLLLGFGLMAVFLVVAVLAPWIAPYDFDAVRDSDGVKFGTQQAPSAAHWLGTTVGGQDVLSRVVFGARTAVEVIVLAVV